MPTHAIIAYARPGRSVYAAQPATIRSARWARAKKWRTEHGSRRTEVPPARLVLPCRPAFVALGDAVVREGGKGQAGSSHPGEDPWTHRVPQQWEGEGDCAVGRPTEKHRKSHGGILRPGREEERGTGVLGVGQGKGGGGSGGRHGWNGMRRLARATQAGETGTESGHRQVCAIRELGMGAALASSPQAARRVLLSATRDATARAVLLYMYPPRVAPVYRPLPVQCTPLHPSSCTHSP
eukprot:scaffold12452_cov113-Isochrysis_galbana.AAC.2